MTDQIDPKTLDDVIVKARDQLLVLLDRSEGYLMSPGHAGVGSTLYALVALHRVDAITPDERKCSRTYLCRYQQPDGSFTNYYTTEDDDRSAAPDEGDLSMTALAASVLRILAGLEEDAAAREELLGRAGKARGWVEARGGTQAVVRELYALKVTALYVALAGDLDPGLLPDLPVEPLLAGPLQGVAADHMNVAFIWMLVAIWAVVRGLKNPEEAASPSWLDKIEHRAAADLIVQFRNPSGDWNFTIFQTTLALCALRMLGVPADDDRVMTGVGWLHEMRDAGNFHQWHQFRTTVWSTALTLRALFCCGARRSDPGVAKALAWLVSAQVHRELPPLQPSPPGAPRYGGWAFERFNVTVPDADDTSVALAALALSLDAPPGDAVDDGAPPQTPPQAFHDGAPPQTPPQALDEALAGRVRGSIELGRAFLLGLQNPDGGWPAFQQGLPSKPPGPILTHYPQFEPGASLENLLLAAHNSIMLGDPATEDITGRALFALARLGYRKGSPVVDAAIAFLARQQCTAAHLGGGPEHGDGGPWWSRWICNYLAATSYAIGGLVAVGVDPGDPMIRRAVAWMKRRQNDDGGWGEHPISYQHPEKAGMGRSTPTMTGLVLCGLLQAGEGGAPEVENGIRYLLASEKGNRWPDEGMLHVFYRTDTMYTFTSALNYYPLEALGRYRAFQAGRAASAAAAPSAPSPALPACAVRDASGAWSPAGLSAMRAQGDPEADAVIRELFEKGEVAAVNDLLRRLMENDEPVPPGLPPIAADYFTRTEELPGWTDPGKLRVAEEMFARSAWATAIALFHAALPQCYAAGDGARVLAGTQSLTRATERRIFETAQFVFDVADRGALAPRGGGVRAAQKVRLLHAAIRHLTLQQPGWSADLGIPINQEDLALTLMSFAIVVLDAWKRMGLGFTPAEDEAWLHAWKVVGHVMGIHPELLPRDCADARALWDAVSTDQWKVSDAGRLLTTSLIDLSERWLPASMFGPLSSTLIRHFSGDRCADILGVPPSAPVESLLREVARGEELLGDPTGQPAVEVVLHAAGRELFKALVASERAGKNTLFRLPQALREGGSLSD